MTAVGSTLYYGADDAKGLGQLWQYTGSGSPIQVTTGSNGYADLGQLTAVGTTLYFAAEDANGLEQLWQSDGNGSPILVTAGPGFVLRRGPGVPDGGGHDAVLRCLGLRQSRGCVAIHGQRQPHRYHRRPRLLGTIRARPAYTLAAGGSMLYFIGYDANNNDQLWQYTGSGSPILVTAGPAFSTRRLASDDLTGVGFMVYFKVSVRIGATTYPGQELWQYTGSGSSSLVASGYPSSLTAVGSTLYFRVATSEPISNRQLWQYGAAAAPPWSPPVPPSRRLTRIRKS